MIAISAGVLAVLYAAMAVWFWYGFRKKMSL